MTLKRLILRLIVAFVLIPAAVFAVLFNLNKNGFFNLQNSIVTIEEIPVGQQAFFAPLEAELIRKLKVFEGRSLWNLSLREVKRAVVANQWVEGVQIKKSWPHSLQIYIRPVQVTALLRLKNSLVSPVTSKGRVLDPVGIHQAPDAVVLAGDLAKDPEVRLKIVQMIARLPKEGALSSSSISEARLEKDGFWVTLMRNGIDVKLGNEQVEVKSARVSKVLEYLDSRQMDARVIDADLSKKVLVRLQQAP